MRALVTGDTIVVSKLDRLARSSRDLQSCMSFRSGRGESWCDSTSEVGRLMLTIMGGIAEFERGLIRKRREEGIQRANALLARLDALISEEADDPAALTHEARQKAEAEVMGDLLAVERDEAALVAGAVTEFAGRAPCRHLAARIAWSAADHGTSRSPAEHQRGACLRHRAAMNTDRAAVGFLPRCRPARPARPGNCGRSSRYRGERRRVPGPRDTDRSPYSGSEKPRWQCRCCWLLPAWSMLGATLQRDGDVMTVVLTTYDDRPKRSNGAKRNGAARVLVSASALAAHLSCVRSYITELVDQGAIERRADGRFDQDQCRSKYIAHLRAEHLRGDFPSLMAKMPFQSTPPRAGDQGMPARSELLRL